MRPNMSNEGIRIPLWVSTILVSLVIPAAIGALGDNPDWKLIAIQSLVTMSILLGGGEVARKRTYSERSVDEIVGQVQQDSYVEGYFNGLMNPEDG